MRMTALSVTNHVLLMTNIPADQPLGGGWETVGRCVNRALHDLEPERSRRLDGLVNIGIDETSYKKDDPELAIVKAAKAKADEIKGSAYMIKVLCFLFDTKYHMHYIISFLGGIGYLINYIIFLSLIHISEPTRH